MNHANLPAVKTASLPASYEAAKLAILECSRIDECKDWADKAQALASYARQSEDTEMEKSAQRIRARAISRCGELLKEVEKQQGARTDKLGMDAHTKYDPVPLLPPTRQQTAKAAGMSKHQAVTAIRVANVPQETFDNLVESDNPPTITKLAELGKQPTKSVPMYEKLGMTKEAFQAGMYFCGYMEQFLKATRVHPAELVVAGCTKQDREKMRESIHQIQEFSTQIDSLVSPLPTVSMDAAKGNDTFITDDGTRFESLENLLEKWVPVVRANDAIIPNINRFVRLLTNDELCRMKRAIAVQWEKLHSLPPPPTK